MLKIIKRLEVEDARTEMEAVSLIQGKQNGLPEKHTGLVISVATEIKNLLSAYCKRLVNISLMIIVVRLKTIDSSPPVGGSERQGSAMNWRREG